MHTSDSHAHHARTSVRIGRQLAQRNDVSNNAVTISTCCNSAAEAQAAEDAYADVSGMPARATRPLTRGSAAAAVRPIHPARTGSTFRLAPRARDRDIRKDAAAAVPALHAQRVSLTTATAAARVSTPAPLSTMSDAARLPTLGAPFAASRCGDAAAHAHDHRLCTGIQVSSIVESKVAHAQRERKADSQLVHVSLVQQAATSQSVLGKGQYGIVYLAHVTTQASSPSSDRRAAVGVSGKASTHQLCTCCPPWDGDSFAASTAIATPHVACPCPCLCPFPHTPAPTCAVAVKLANISPDLLQTASRTVRPAGRNAQLYSHSMYRFSLNPFREMVSARALTCLLLGGVTPHFPMVYYSSVVWGTASPPPNDQQGTPQSAKILVRAVAPRPTRGGRVQRPALVQPQPQAQAREHEPTVAQPQVQPQPQAQGAQRKRRRDEHIIQFHPSVHTTASTAAGTVAYPGHGYADGRDDDKPTECTSSSPTEDIPAACIVSELCNSSLLQVIERFEASPVVVSDKAFQSVIMQVLQALSCMQNLLHAHHNDLHCSNVMLAWVPHHFAMRYVLKLGNNGVAVTVPSCGISCRIIDYGLMTSDVLFGAGDNEFAYRYRQSDTLLFIQNHFMSLFEESCKEWARWRFQMLPVAFLDVIRLASDVQARVSAQYIQPWRDLRHLMYTIADTIHAAHRKAEGMHSADAASAHAGCAASSHVASHSSPPVQLPAKPRRVTMIRDFLAAEACIGDLKYPLVAHDADGTPQRQYKTPRHVPPASHILSSLQHPGDALEMLMLALAHKWGMACEFGGGASATVPSSAAMPVSTAKTGAEEASDVLPSASIATYRNHLTAGQREALADVFLTAKDGVVCSDAAAS